MVLRFIIHFFRSRFGESAVDKLADSPPFRRAARILVRLFLESKALMPPDAQNKLKDAVTNTKQFQDMANRVKEQLQKRKKF